MFPRDPCTFAVRRSIKAGFYAEIAGGGGGHSMGVSFKSVGTREPIFKSKYKIYSLSKFISL